MNKKFYNKTNSEPKAFKALKNAKAFYITTPIYYINDVPHVGHAYTTIAADVLSRHYKSKGEDVFFLTGVDEHGAKIAEAAKKANLEPKAFADSLVPRFQEAWKNLNIDYSKFFRTTNPKHEEIVKNLILELKEKGYVEKKKYTGLYCTACEKFLLPDELTDGCCPDHGTKPEEHSEENYFFLLPKAAKDKDLLGVIERGEIIVEPVARKNEVIGKIKQGLEDVSISREKVEWGIPFPGDESQTIYVWIDALINYYSAEFIYFPDCHPERSLRSDPVGEGSVSLSDNLASARDSSAVSPQNDKNCVWPADIHLMAKDILWFHAIIWPAMLLALDLPLPKKVFAHGFFTVGGNKMSKTRGNVLDPNKLVEKFGSDAVRYTLLREFPFGEDGDISEEKIAARYTSELSNGLGNLVQRTLSMINRYEVVIPELIGDPLIVDSHLHGNDKLIEELKFDQALQEIMSEVSRLNQFIEENKPWALAKTDQNKLTEVLLEVYNSLKAIPDQIAPFIPETAEKMKKQLETLEPEPLFPRLS